MSLGKWRRPAVFAAAALSFEGVAWAQHGYMSARMLNPSQAHSLDKAILVIGIPPLMMFLGIFFYFYRRRRATSHNP
jgi:hypothetical protein